MSPAPLLFFEDLRVCRVYGFADSRERFPTPVVKFLDVPVD